MKKKQTARPCISQERLFKRSGATDPSELVIQFTDGSRIFADVKEDALELSITGCSND
ncbi:hypothetical protein [Xanthomonas campestris]|uniref:hypothetical protein n=1 Tax=Xanthomonas campestris TaxID=339 RepID=UPI002366B834|nr:hypothetical protein [Xanthomonas campestris]MEA9709846.1 hypothetical protein [Xanthomonas campestris]MEA9784141.1 hypothetical protein [Xanthomonas campestris pv. raphani]MEA9804451.1 hypothetical protein [Xanthomonas campestris pv. raphani]MEA9821099.1 hypothetical protein [Xanthomonas campestris pv. raphani]MEA9873691.1 hypothetical protein [Xanthomonas campestris pv. raphani]